MRQNFIDEIVINEAIIEQFLEAHNYVKRIVDSLSSNMKVIKWDEELANLAQNLIRFEHWFSLFELNYLCYVS